MATGLRQFADSQTSAADIAANVILIAGTYVASKQIAGGALTAGNALAAALAQTLAINSSWAGGTLAGLWYGIFPAKASLVLAVTSVVSVMMLLAVLSSVAGVITDPIQSKFGWHQKRLNKMMTKMEGDLLGKKIKGYETKGPLLAKVLDIIAWVKQGVAALKTKLPNQCPIQCP